MCYQANNQNGKSRDITLMITLLECTSNLFNFVKICIQQACLRQIVQVDLFQTELILRVLTFEEGLAFLTIYSFCKLWVITYMKTLIHIYGIFGFSSEIWDQIWTFWGNWYLISYAVNKLLMNKLYHGYIYITDNLNRFLPMLNSDKC